MTLALLGVALGGFLGGIGRYLLVGLVGRRLGERFPWGTLFVNVTGALAIGALAAVVGPESEGARGAVWRGVVVGILGSYTTVSSFSLQTLALIQARDTRGAALNVVGSVLLCIGGAAVAYAGVRWMVGA